MDLKSYKRHTLLHLIDHFTNFTVSSVIPNKKTESIIQSIFKIWISVYGSAENFSQTMVANLPTRILWICVKLLGLL